MSERQKQVCFLKALATRDASTEFQLLQHKIQHAERQERCVRRMIFLVFVLMLLSIACLAYGTVFQPHFFRDWTQLVVKLPCSLGLASIICLLFFTAYWSWHRAILNGFYAECRKLIIKK